MYTLEGGKKNYIFFPGQKTGCTHGDHDEEEEARETGPMITEIWTNKEGHRPTVVRLPSPAHYRPLFNQPIAAVMGPIKLRE